MVFVGRVSSLSVVGIILLLCSGCKLEENTEAVSVLKLTTVLPPDHPSSHALAFFEKQVEALSDESIDVKVFYNGQLGSAVETVELCRAGNIEIINCSSAYLAQLLPLFKVLEMPFMFRNSEHQYSVLDGTVGHELKQEIEALDLKLLAFFDAGSRNVMTKERPVVIPDDLKGLKIRVMPSPLLLSSINAIGASAIPMNQGEVYSALQMGVLNGWENNPPTALYFRMYETGCIYYSKTSHSSIPDVLVMSQRSFERLSPSQQTVVMEVAKATQIKQRELWVSAEIEAISKLQEAGMKFSEVDQPMFKARVTRIYEEMFERYGEELKRLCELIQEESL